MTLFLYPPGAVTLFTYPPWLDNPNVGFYAQHQTRRCSVVRGWHFDSEEVVQVAWPYPATSGTIGTGCTAKRPCDRCGDRPYDLFWTPDPASHGAYLLCRPCVFRQREGLPLSQEPWADRCPTCGFGLLSTTQGEGIDERECVWGHRWRRT